MTIYAVILVLLHALVSLFEVVLLTWHGLRRSVRWLTKFGGCPGPEEIQRLAAHLEKIPVHLGIVIVEDAISFVDIARMVVWSTALGVAYVTIYDHKGRCKRAQQEFLRHLDEQQRLFVQDRVCQELSITLHSGSRFQTVSGSKSIGESRKGVGTCVRVVGPDDGKQRIVDISKRISVAVVRQQISADDVTVSYIDSLVQEADGFCDPDLVVKFGAVNSLLGFLPWQTRLSEILFVPTHHHLDLHQFGATLHSYGSTEQRCGK